MRLINRHKYTIVLFALILLSQPLYADNHGDSDYGDLNPRVLEAINRGMEWLKTQQEDSGLFRHHPGITGLAITAFLRHPHNQYTEADNPFIQKSIRVLLSMQQPDGGIYNVEMQPALPNYNTSVSLMALSSTNNPNYEMAIAKAQGFIKSLQVTDESEVYFGGIGYGSRESVHDLSNMNIAIQALRESGSDDPEVWDKAIKFLERCQNRSETNDQDWAGDDGGFIYAPDGESKAGEHRSYASMTYAGLLSFIYANVDRDDPRVQSAVDWITKHFTVEENYGMEQQGLFYNYHTMAKALKAYGQPTIVDSKGVTHDWYRTLAEKLISEQTPEGFWVNKNSRWMERDPVLVTSYALMALATAYPE